GRDAVRRVNSWACADPAFSRALGAAGFIGMTWPRRYGGQERSALERYVVLEELLAAGMPVGFHWIADRQSGPLLLRYGTEGQRTQFLPPMARGELCFAIGMSEPGAGSDLAAVRTKAARVDGGWRVTGQKVWTTNAHVAGAMIALVRTGEGAARHEGLSQMIVDLASPGVTVRPIADLAGGADFNEVFLDDVFVPDAMLVGCEGDGWRQVTAELSLERSGPERYLSSFALFVELLRAAGPKPAEPVRGLIGRLTAELWTLRQMSLSVAAQLAQGHDPAIEAAIVKDMGNRFEQDMPRLVQGVIGDDLAAKADLARVLTLLLQIAPSFSLRGGTREVLRGIIARGLGLR
ncbi:MAG: acyl-CoA dehydrogenase, partial [Alphaproteobacteria bacterium]